MSVNIMISRTDNIGDVILTLPLAGYLKSKFGDKYHIFFLGKPYTKDIIESCPHIDEFVDVTNLNTEKLKALNIEWFFHIFPNKELAIMARQAGVTHRVGTSHRLFHWGKCNHRVRFTRKKSDLHESQLNFKLLKPLIGEVEPTMNEMAEYALFDTKPLEQNPKTVILHTMSNGSAVNWSFENFKTLARELVKAGFQVSLTGTEKEGQFIRTQFSEEIAEGICQDVTGKFSLAELMAYIKGCHSLVAASTGPLHLASVLGIHAFGLYSQVKPMHAGRWAPVGEHVHIIDADDAGMKPDINLISWQRVLDQIVVNG